MHSPSLALDPSELGRRGAEKSIETRREQAKSVRDRLRDKVEEHAELVWGAFHDGLTSDDERVRVGAAQALLAEAYGKPAVAITGDGDKPLSIVVRSAFAIDEGGDG